MPIQAENMGQINTEWECAVIVSTELTTNPFSSPTISEIINVMGTDSITSTPPTLCIDSPLLNTPPTPLQDEMPAQNFNPHAATTITSDLTNKTAMSKETAKLCAKQLEAMDQAVVEGGDNIDSSDICNVKHRRCPGNKYL
jgi:hypothetical protein